ncbi:MAG: hypothetical protein QOD69_2525 [Solirubrobacteraceae bacterium]|nr:hypothetical protein [Solirubrobacteraceae bacterium]
MEEAAWWRSSEPASVRDVVRRSFEARLLCISSEEALSWRNSLSYVGGTPDPLDTVICSHEYERAEVTLPPDGPLSHPYPWLRRVAAESKTLYTASGMAAIAGWLTGVAGVAAQRDQHHVVLTNQVYYETQRLFGLAGLQHVTIRGFAGLDEILDAMAQARQPVAVLLDSTYPGGDPASVARVMRAADPERVGCVAWDSTCAPAVADPCASLTSLPVALAVLRSHPKLDQLGLELCGFGSATIAYDGPAEPHPSSWGSQLRFYVESVMEVSGTFAPASSVRLMARSGVLPVPPLAVDANARVRGANRIGRSVLARELEATGRFVVRAYEHACFVTIHLLGPAAPSREDELDAEVYALEALGAQHGMAVWRSASFGFHYTALSAYEAKGPPETRGLPPHGVIRMAFGAHDPDVCEDVAVLVADYLRGRW